MRSVLSFGLVALLAVAATTLTGCVEDDVGVRCTIAGSGVGGGDTESNIFDLQALECESRICIHYRSGDKGPRCTLPCEDDSDCPEDGVAGCDKGFVCRIGNVFGALQCCKFCVCKNDVPGGEDPLKVDCQGKDVKCPNI